MSEDLPVADKITLTSIGFEALQIFQDLLHNANHGGVDYDAILHQEERYDLWAINIGLYQSGHGSLDYRFRDAPALFSHCERLLNDLRDLLQTLSSELSDNNEVTDDLGSSSALESIDDSSDGDFDDFDHDEYDDQNVAQAILEGIVDCINRLYQLSMKVQAASRRLGSSRGYSYRRLDDDSGLDFFDRFAQLNVDEMHIKELLISLRNGSTSSLSKDGILIARLAKANNQRRRQFGYWSQHKINLVRRSEAAKERRMPGQPGLTPSEISKPTTATQLNPSAINLYEDSQSVTSAISIDVSDVKDSGEELEFPGPPEKYLTQDDLKEFECPYCFTACSTRFLNPRKWRAHLLKDLRPYTCIVERCKDASQLYDSFTDWANHDVQHNTKLLNTTDRQCPFCLKSIQDIKVFYKHVANHLVRVALFSLPRSTGAEIDQDGGSAVSDLAVQSDDALETNSTWSLASSGTPLGGTLEQIESLSMQDRVAGWVDDPIDSPPSNMVPDAISEVRAKIRALDALCHDKWIPESQEFLKSPPSDRAQRENEYRRLSESVMKQIIEAADAIELEGDQTARAERKKVVGNAQDLLRRLDVSIRTKQKQEEEEEERRRISLEYQLKEAQKEEAKGRLRESILREEMEWKAKMEDEKRQEETPISKLNDEQERTEEERVFGERLREEAPYRAEKEKEYEEQSKNLEPTASTATPISDINSDTVPGSSADARPSSEERKRIIEELKLKEAQYVEEEEALREKILREEEELEQKARAKAIKAGYSEEYAEELLRKNKAEHRGRHRSPPPASSTDDQSSATWIRIARKHILPITLDTYRLKWDYDPDDDNYIIIKDYIDHQLQREIFAHTKRIIQSRRETEDDRPRRYQIVEPLEDDDEEVVEVEDSPRPARPVRRPAMSNIGTLQDPTEAESPPTEDSNNDGFEDGRGRRPRRATSF